jgi:hypothetical protein
MNPISHRDQRRALAPTLVALAALAAAACGSTPDKPAPRGAVAHAPAPRAPATPAQTFSSRPYGFRVTLSKDWSGTDALVVWDGKKLQGLSSPAFANFTDPATDRTLAVAAARVRKGLKLAEWRAAMIRAAPDVCSDSRSVAATTLGGEAALAWTATCSDGYDVHKLAALRGGRGYMILFASQTANDDVADRRIFELIRRSFRFTRS